MDVTQFPTEDFRYLYLSQVTGSDIEGYYDYDFECLHWDQMFTITYSIGDNEWYGMVIPECQLMDFDEVYLTSTQVAHCVTLIPLSDLPENIVI